MNCPNCGSKTVSDQQFCRSCGTELVEQKPPRFKLQTLGLIAMLLFFGGLLISLTGKFVEIRWVTFAGTFIMVAGMFVLMCFAFLWDTRSRRKKNRITLPDSLSAAADTTNKLRLPEGTHDHIPSVTERTTDLLETPVSKNTR